ncbi:MAG: cytochrome ubiquinol oxidase subunit I [Deltaproteobacteria bacterium]|nr:cytochrome ubiquinol oxidase subunit I [Deltaproteobacteria bacterium]
MLESVDLSLVAWSRAQFALTAMYHWIFVPLTLGLSFLVAFFETIYVKTGREEWKRIAKFWMTLFGINFAIGVATGIILEFEFGTNWSNYSWMVGDIFGAPLAAEGIFAFFIEATFFAVMFFGWERVSKTFHLFSTWMVAVGSSLSALWILVANAWMQYPVGMTFNPALARFEMENFWEVLFSPAAISHFTHTTSSAFVLSALFVLTVSSWFLLRGRHVDKAKKSIIVASVFGVISSGYVIFSGDESAYTAARVQPMKLAAMEGLFTGENGAGLVVMGILDPSKQPGDDKDPFFLEIKVPGLLSLLANRETGSFVPGVDDLIYGNAQHGIMGVTERMARGREAVVHLAAYKDALAKGDVAGQQLALAAFEPVRGYLGYGHLQKPEDAVPPLGLVFYSFHVMVALGSLFPLIFLAFLVLTAKDRIEGARWLHYIGLSGVFLAFVAGQAGWIVAEVGRQPWAIQDLLPVGVAVTNIARANVQVTFFMFLILFTALLLAEIRIMCTQIAKGPEED